MVSKSININMRCIEIALNAWVDEMKEINKSEPTSYTININMRCIEMRISVAIEDFKTKININMRCIEILAFFLFLFGDCRLTLT